jgi:DNA-binding transcriptional ArsR family regulator
MAPYDLPMSEVLDMAAVAALVGDPARANILCALMDGRAFTAGELAYAAHVSPQTASGHLGKLKGAQLIVSSPQGRHRYYRLAGPHVAAMLESIMAVAAVAPPRCRPIRIDHDMRNARLCYDHVAGRLGVGLADALRARDHLELSHDGAALTASGELSCMNSASTSKPPVTAAGFSAVPASIGASGGPTSQAPSAPRSPNACWLCAGSHACATAAPWSSRRRAAATWSKHSASCCPSSRSGARAPWWPCPRELVRRCRPLGGLNQASRRRER